MKPIKISTKLKPPFLTKLLSNDTYLKPALFFCVFASLAVIVWFFGPVIAWDNYFPLASTDKRLYVILSLFLLWLLKFLLIDLDASNPFQYKDSATRKKLQPLQNQFQGAMRFLKKTIITKHHQQVCLHELPWYLLLGPQGSGKTSLLANSNVNFVLQRQFQQQDTKNLETSDNCNWWVTRDASMVDVPGKYLGSNEKQTASSLFWRFFLRLIKKHRGKKGIEGIVIALPLPELLMQVDVKQLHILQHNLFQRLSELKKVFPQTMPCYLLITKCDLLPGFSEYFSEMSNDEISQAWGIMLTEPENNEPIYDLFLQRFNALIRKLNQQLIWRLHQERNPASRPAIKDFPLQVERLKEFTFDFIKKLLAHPLQLSLQGVFLTSALQTPQEPKNPLLEDLQQSAQSVRLIKEPSLASRAYFIKQFISHGLTHTAAIAPVNKLHIWKRRLAYALSIGFVSVTALLLGHDFEVGVKKAYSIQNNLAEYRLAIQHFQNPDETLTNTVALLDTLQKSYQYAGFKLDLSHLLTFYSNKSQEKAGLVYQEALQTILLPEIKNYFEDCLSNPVNKNSDYLYSVLKAYLMLGDIAKLQPQTILNTLQSLSPKTIDQEAKDRLAAHLTAALTSMKKPLALNPTIIQKTREFLNGLPSLQLAQIILKNVNSNEIDNDINLGINTTGNPIFTSQQVMAQFPLMYTAKNLSSNLSQLIPTAAQEALKGNWILGMNGNLITNPTVITALSDQLRTSYINNYVDTWEKVVDNIRLFSPKDLSQTDAMILDLTGDQSPLLQFLQTLRANTYFEPIISASPKLQNLDELIDKNNPSANLLVQIFAGLQLMHQYLQPIITAPDPRKAAFEALSYRVKHNDKPDALTQLRLIAEKSPEPIKTWLDQMSNSTWHLLMNDAGHYLNTAWEEQVLRYYHAEIANRYPFAAANNSHEVELQKFALFFGNPGIVLNFYHTMLAPFVDVSKPEWHWKMAGNEKLPFSDETLRQFQHAMRIHHSFFPNGDDKLYLQFAVEPFQFGKHVKRVQLTINDKQIIDEDSNVRSPHVVTWPNSNKTKMTMLQFTLLSKEVLAKQFPGDWGWFKLVNQTYEGMISKKQTLLNFSMNNAPVRYYLYTDNQVNPFLSLNLQHFALPEKL